jgi:hypothetical protein
MVYKTENGDVRVKPPPISVSPLPQKFKALQVLNKCLFILTQISKNVLQICAILFCSLKKNVISCFQEYFGGDCEVVVLPSGTAVRIKNSIAADPEKDSEKKFFAAGKRKRKQSEIEQHHQQATPVKMAPSYEVFPPG